MKRTLINELKENVTSNIRGFAEKIRNTKYMIFIILRDRSGIIQVSISKEQEELVKKMENVLDDSILEFNGHMVLSEYVKMGGKEFIPDDLKVLSAADAIPLEENASLDTKLDYRFLDLRSEKNNLMLKCQSALVEGMRNYYYQEDLIESHTQKLIK